MLAALSSSAIRLFWVLYKCNTELMVRVPFPGSGRAWNLLVADMAVPAWLAFIEVMELHSYLFRESAGGTYNCRPVNHNPDNPYSIHSYGLAVDLNPSKNPQGTKTTDMPPGFITDVKALKTVNGRPLFRWGGDWSGSTSDPMHWQISATPADIATGIVGSTPDRQPEGDDEMALKEGDYGRAVRAMKKAYNDWSAEVNVGRPVDVTDGSFGPAMKALIEEFQAWSQLPVTGIVDGVTAWYLGRWERLAETGPQGPAGPRGPAGPPGPKGDPGEGLELADLRVVRVQE